MFLSCGCRYWSSWLLQLLFWGTVDGAITSHRHSNYYVWVAASRCRRLDRSLVISWQGAWIQCFGYGRFAPLIRFLILLVVELPVFALLAPDIPSLIIVVFAIIFTWRFLFLFLRRELGGSCISFHFNSGGIIFSSCCCGVGSHSCRLGIGVDSLSFWFFFLWAVRLRAWLVLLFIIILALLISLISHHGLLVVSFIGQVRCKGLNRGILWHHPHQLLLNLICCDVILRLKSHQEL